jgi:uncharacterized protein involved in type VI secretion and phage assembly
LQRSANAFWTAKWEVKCLDWPLNLRFEQDRMKPLRSGSTSSRVWQDKSVSAIVDSVLAAHPQVAWAYADCIEPPLAASANAGQRSYVVQLTREDKAIDHGYLALVRGDPKAKEDTPDLMLYIVQDSKRAKAKGKEPMTKDAFIAMAERVAASVRLRPVSGK